jgi:hypothetical protein
MFSTIKSPSVASAEQRQIRIPSRGADSGWTNASVRWIARAAPQEPASRYAEALRIQSEQTQSISKELLEMIRQGEKDPEVLMSVGRRFLAQFDGAIAAVENYRKATTRFGLQSEIDDMLLMYRSLQLGQRAVFSLTDTAPPPALSQRDISLTGEIFQTEIVPMIKEFVDLQLNAQGAADFLTEPGFRQAAIIVVNHVGLEVNAMIEAEVQKIVGVRIHLGMSLKEHLLMMARSWVSRSVGNVILRMAATHFIVETLGVRLLEWVGPKLREFLRPKGNLESRTDRAVSGLRQRRGDLDRMDSGEELIDVRRFIEAATNHVKANGYLRGDLQRGRRDDLYQRLSAEETELLRAIERAKTRFLMNSPLVQESFGELVREMRAGRAKTAEVLDKLAITPTATLGAYEAVARPESKERFPGQFGLNIRSSGRGYQVRVTDPSGRMLVDNPFSPQDGSSDLFECRDAVWSDGTPLKVSLHVNDRDASGSPKSGWMSWWSQTRSVFLLGIHFFKRGTLFYEAHFVAGSKGSQAGFPGKYRMELSPAGIAQDVSIGFGGANRVLKYPFRVRVIDPRGRVILNTVLMPAPVRETGTSNIFLVYQGGPVAWTDGTPVPRVSLGMISGRANPHDTKDIVPNTGSLRWLSDDSGSRSSILFVLDFMPLVK